MRSIIMYRNIYIPKVDNIRAPAAGHWVSIKHGRQQLGCQLGERLLVTEWLTAKDDKQLDPTALEFFFGVWKRVNWRTYRENDK